MIQWKKKTFLNRQHFLPRVFCYNEKKSCGLLILTFPPKSKLNCLINAVGLLLLFSPIIIISFFKYTVKQDRMIGNRRLIIILSHYNNIISYIFNKIKSVAFLSNKKESCEILSTTFPILHFKPNSIFICLAKKDFEKTTITNTMKMMK